MAAGRIAYIKPTGSDEAHRLGLLPANIDLPAGMKLYVLHAEDGSVLGFTDGYASRLWRGGAERTDAGQRALTPASRKYKKAGKHLLPAFLFAG